MAEGEGFEPSIPVSRDKRLAGARTRPLCDPSGSCDAFYHSPSINFCRPSTCPLFPSRIGTAKRLPKEIRCSPLRFVRENPMSGVPAQP